MFDDAVNLDAPYERHRFAVGDRVICQPAEECRCWESEKFGFHRREMKGRTGTVIAVGATVAKIFGHHIQVRFDTPLGGPVFFATASHFAAMELEPLDVTT